MRACQLQPRDEDLEEATLLLQCIHLEEKERHDNKHNICVEKLTVGQIVLLHNTKREKDMS